MDTAVELERRTAPAHAALLGVVVVWASAFSAVKALIDHGFAPEDVAVPRYLVAAPGFAFLLWKAGGLPWLTRRGALRLAAVGVCVVVGYHVFLNLGTKSTTSGTAGPRGSARPRRRGLRPAGENLSRTHSAAREPVAK